MPAYLIMLCANARGRIPSGLKFMQAISQTKFMPFCKTQNLDIYHEQAGAGAPLLYIGGSGADLRQKPSIMDTPLSSHFQLTSYDQRGLGQTEKPQTGYTMAAYADDAAALLDALGIERAHILGISFGGMVAQHFALRHSDRVSRLAMFCTAAGGAGGASYPLQNLRDMEPEPRLHTYMKLSDTRVDDAFLANNPELVDNARKRMAASPYADEPGHERGLIGQLEARHGHDCWDELASITGPVWLGAGKYDSIAPPEVMQNMASKIPHADLKFYEGGHLFMTQDGQVFPDLITFFNQES